MGKQRAVQLGVVVSDLLSNCCPHTTTTTTDREQNTASFTLLWCLDGRSEPAEKERGQSAKKVFWLWVEALLKFARDGPSFIIHCGGWLLSKSIFDWGRVVVGCVEEDQEEASKIGTIIA